MSRKIVIAGTAIALTAGFAIAAEYPTKMEGKASIACNFERDLVYGRKLEMAKDYVTDGIVEHNTTAAGVGIKALQDGLAKMPPLSAKGGGCGQPKVVVVSDDYVVFISEQPERDDPRVPGRKIRPSHFDAYRFEGDKIAEHWD